MRLAWVTDPHLNFLSPESAADFWAEVAANRPDALVVGGDIAEAPTVEFHLRLLEGTVECPVYFVLGNHDFYRGSIRQVRARVAELARASQRLRWLPESGVVPLTDEACLLGHDGWGDGRLGNAAGSTVLLNDFLLIHELASLARPELLARLNALGDEAAAYLAGQLPAALARFAHVYVLVHVPPFREACWYEGHISDDDWLPFFGCHAVGDVLAAAMRAHPHRHMTVLCGHTHSSGVAQILPNLEVKTGAARYGSPQVQEVFLVR